MARPAKRKRKYCATWKVCGSVLGSCANSFRGVGLLPCNVKAAKRQKGREDVWVCLLMSVGVCSLFSRFALCLLVGPSDASLQRVIGWVQSGL